MWSLRYGRWRIAQLQKELTNLRIGMVQFCTVTSDGGKCTDSLLENKFISKRNTDCRVPTIYSPAEGKIEFDETHLQPSIDLKRFDEFIQNVSCKEKIQPFFEFMKNEGIPPIAISDTLIKNPSLFKIDLCELETRINYLKSLAFSNSQCQRIITANTYWLMFSPPRIERRLNFFRQNFKLSEDDMRYLVSKTPRLITYNMAHISKMTFFFQKEIEFSVKETRQILLSKPRIWMMNVESITERASYILHGMKLTKHQLVSFPALLTCRKHRLSERHEFLKFLQRANYEPTGDRYISPNLLIEGTNKYFVTQIARSDMKTYELFVKSL